MPVKAQATLHRLQKSLRRCRRESLSDARAGNGSACGGEGGSEPRHPENFSTCPVQVVEKYPLKIRNMITQMEREIRVHKRLRHPNILHLHACFEEGLKLFQDFESDSMQIPSISGQHPLVHGAGARKSFGEPPASLPLEAASRASGGMALRPGPDPLKASLTWTPKNLPFFGFLIMISLYKSLNRNCRFFGV